MSDQPSNPPKPRLYPKVEAERWIQPVRMGYRMACCDCCLVHEIDFRIVRGRVQIRGRRNNRATAALRRARGVTVRT